jgi:hypothetical protein
MPIGKKKVKAWVRGDLAPSMARTVTGLPMICDDFPYLQSRAK